MRTLYKQLLDGQISRRDFLQQVAVYGVTATSASTLLADVADAAIDPEADIVLREVTGNGADMLVESLIEANVKHVFHGCGGGINRFFDSFVTRDEFTNFLGTQEGQIVAMAEGYHLVSGEIGVVLVPRPGLPNAAGNILNAMAHRSSLLVLTARESKISSERRGNNELIEWDDVMEPFMKWLYKMDRTDRIPEFTRRAIKVATAPLGGPAFLGMTEDLYDDEQTATLVPQELFKVKGRIKPDPEQIGQLADMLMAAEKPMIIAGLEVTKAGAERELIELAETLGVPVSQGLSLFADFPTRHPLALGQYTKFMGFTRGCDLCVIIGAQMPDEANYIITGPPPTDATLVHISMDPDLLGVALPTKLSILSDVRESIVALLNKVKPRARKRSARSRIQARTDVATEYVAKQRERMMSRAERKFEKTPITNARLATELDKALDNDAIIASEALFGVAEYFDAGVDAKLQLGPQPGEILGWATGVAMGAKLAAPERQVVALSGDGAFLFSNNLWSISRYKAPILIVVLNNRAYNINRAFNWLSGGAQAKLKKDMLTYLGDPDMNFVLYANAHGIEGENVTEPGDLASAIQRGIAANTAGKPYLLDVYTERWGAGGDQEWHPDISIADMAAST